MDVWAPVLWYAAPTFWMISGSPTHNHTPCVCVCVTGGRRDIHS